MRAKHLFYAFILGLALAPPLLHAAWTDATAGLPWLEYFSAKDIGTNDEQWFVASDKSGRLFVGGEGLFVFDGRGWRKYPVGSSYAVRTLQFASDRIWVAGANELGYMQEVSVGDFRYHSLVDQLPENERQIGQIWGSALVASKVYFFGREKLYCWDGQTFRIWSFPSKTKSRLFPMALEGEGWFHDLETGLYRLTADGPKLEVEPSQLPAAAILGLCRDKEGLLLVSDAGFFRPAANKGRAVFDEKVNRFIAGNLLCTYTTLTGGVHAVGTGTSGLLLVSPDGKLLRLFDATSGLPGSAVFSISQDTSGHVWCSSANGIYHFEQDGHVTLFNRKNGLGDSASSISANGNNLYVGTTGGVYHLTARASQSASMAVMPDLAKGYIAVQVEDEGLLLGRHGGLDYFNGKTVANIYSMAASNVNAIYPSRLTAGTWWLAEASAISRLEAQPGHGFGVSRITSFPDYPLGGIQEDSHGRLWYGTGGTGVFVYDPKTGVSQPARDPETHEPFKGTVRLENDGQSLWVFGHGKALRETPPASELSVAAILSGAEDIQGSTVIGPGKFVVSFRRAKASGTSSWGQGIGILEVTPSGPARWQELDVPALDTIGLVKTMQLTREKDQPVLWLGGTDGILRLDYAALVPMSVPSPPSIRLDTLNSTPSVTKGGIIGFPFKGHHLYFRLFTGEYVQSREWMIQSRLTQGTGEWSAPATTRTFEFGNLSEGNYRFEVRTINAAGMTSAPSVFSFRILPPWYRSNGAFAGYAVALALGIWGFVRIRERRIRAENEKLEGLVDARTAELVKANAAKDDFLAGVSHEIRNPMNGVIGISESLKTAGLDAESRRKFGLLRQCASHLSSLLEDILDISKVQAGVIELDVKSFDLYELTDAILAMSASDSEKYHIPVEVAISPGVPRYLHGDPRRIRQILLNFVSNALKFSGRGQVSVTVWCKPTGTPERTEVVFAISDDGPGISAEEQKKLFHRFERGAAARQGRVPGTGLGLALCKGFAEKMGGKIWLESEPGQGSCFYFSAPFLVATDPVELEPAPSVEVTGNKKALVVDDQEYNRIVLADLLAKLGYVATTAGEGASALQLAEKEIFALVFLDYDLPGMSGLEVARGIRALPTATAAAHILATTAFTTPEKQAQCLAAGMNAFLGKPVTLERLRKALAGAGLELSAPPHPYPSVADGLANLRLLATKKNVRFEDELALYLSELNLELDNLGAAIHDEDIPEAAHYAHLLCGRSSFIYERDLEQNFRRLEEIVARGHWADARQLVGELRKLAAALPLKLASGGPTVPPA